jgi:hypothetical protein
MSPRKLHALGWGLGIMTGGDFGWPDYNNTCLDETP